MLGMSWCFLNFLTYICKDPKINDATQEPVNCTNYTAHGKTSRIISLTLIFKTNYYISWIGISPLKIMNVFFLRLHVTQFSEQCKFRELASTC